MSNFSQAMNRWFTEIVSEVGIAHQKTQRKTKTFINRKNQKAEYRKLTDVTFTKNQDKYTNTSIPLIVKGVLGNNLDTQCFVGAPKIDAMLDNRAAALFTLGNYSDAKSLRDYQILIEDFKRSFNSPQKEVYDAFLDRLLDSKSPYQLFFPVDVKENPQRVKKDLKDAQIRFLAKAYIPPTLWASLKVNFSKDYDELFRLIGLIRDTQLRQELVKVLPKTTKSNKLIAQFLNNRLSGLGADVSQELQAELAAYFPEVNINTESNINKCVMSLFLNIKKALAVQKQGPRNLKKIRMPQGLDRRHLPPAWAALVRPERAKVALRHAIHSYTSGLNLIAKGLSENNASYLVRGYSFIFNIRSRDFERHVSETASKKRTLAQSCPLYDMNSELTEDFTCDEFRRKTCAASALLIAYFELVDTLVSPSPPLITRQNMQVREFYVNPHQLDASRLELYDVSEFSTWSADKKRAFQHAYKRFVARYQNVGFTTTDHVGPHGMRLLNLEDWGRRDQAVVTNPFRVREDTFIFKYFGAFRLEFNRCSIGPVARSIWRQHQISYTYDPDYCHAFVKETKRFDKSSLFPRPVFDINYYNPKPGPDATEGAPLYFNVSSFEVYGPQPACARREWINRMTMKEWVSGPPDHTPSLKKLTDAKLLSSSYTSSVKMSREANAMLDVHKNFRALGNPFRMPFVNAQGRGVQYPTCFAYDIGPNIDPEYRKYFLYRPIVTSEKTNGDVVYAYGKQGIEPNPSGWAYWREQNPNNPVFRRDPFTTYDTNLETPTQVDRMLTEPPPALFNRLKDPVTHVEIPLQFFQQAAQLQETEEWPEYNEDNKDDCRHFYANFLTQSLKNILQCLKGLPSWFITNFTDLTIDVAYPYPLLTQSGELGANVLPIGHSGDGSPPFALVPSSIFVLFPNRQNNFWDLRNSLLYLLSDQRLFMSVDKAKDALTTYLDEIA